MEPEPLSKSRRLLGRLFLATTFVFGFIAFGFMYYIVITVAKSSDYSQMEVMGSLAGHALPLTLFVVAGSYCGFRKRDRNWVKLPKYEVLMLFLFLWVITAALENVLPALLSGQDELTRSQLGKFWGPLLIGVPIGRTIVAWRRKAHSLSISEMSNTAPIQRST